MNHNKYKKVVVFLLNKNNQILLLKRSPKEKHNPNKWAVLAGHIEEFDKSTEESTKREIKEELGIDISTNDLVKIKLEEDDIHTCFYYIKIKDTEFILDENEVVDTKWFDINKVIEMMKNSNENIVFSTRIIKLLEKITNQL